MCTFHLLQNIISLHSIVVVDDVANLSKWLFFNTKKATFQLYFGKNKLYFDEM